MEFFKAPPLTTRGGKILWAGIVPVYWSIAYIVAAAIPNFFGLSSLVAALFHVHVPADVVCRLLYQVGGAAAGGGVRSSDGDDDSDGWWVETHSERV
ncbi:amino acid transporter protein [Rutstroemia sp. NJR-2017a BBW]|nr:amino acid transporter protein [Rutstroemia sp. NJR-2017a BBW]